MDDIDDPRPVRRNLILTSVAFIVYFIADGYISHKDGYKISLSIVNIHFDNPDVLIFSAWIILFWFAWRY